MVVSCKAEIPVTGRLRQAGLRVPPTLTVGTITLIAIVFSGLKEKTDVGSGTMP